MGLMTAADARRKELEDKLRMREWNQTLVESQMAGMDRELSAGDKASSQRVDLLRALAGRNSEQRDKIGSTPSVDQQEHSIAARMQSGSNGRVDPLSALNGRLGAYQAAASRRKNKKNPGTTTADRVASRREQYDSFQPASSTARGVAQILAGKGDPTSSESFGNNSQLEQYADGTQALRGGRGQLEKRESQPDRIRSVRNARNDREDRRKSAVNAAVVAALSGGEYQPTGDAKADAAAQNIYRRRREQMGQEANQGQRQLMALAGQSPGGVQAYLNQMGANQRAIADQQMLGQELASRERIAEMQTGGPQPIDKTQAEMLQGIIADPSSSPERRQQAQASYDAMAGIPVSDGGEVRSASFGVSANGEVRSAKSPGEAVDRLIDAENKGELTPDNALKLAQEMGVSGEFNRRRKGLMSRFAESIGLVVDPRERLRILEQRARAGQQADRGLEVVEGRDGWGPNLREQYLNGMR